MFRFIPTRPRWVQEKSTVDERAVVDFIHGCLTRRVDTRMLDRAAAAVLAWWCAKLSADRRALTEAQTRFLRWKATELMMQNVTRDPAGWWEFGVMPESGDELVPLFVGCLETEWLDPEPEPASPPLDPSSPVDPF
jgi:hypothetical protein